MDTESKDQTNALLSPFQVCIAEDVTKGIYVLQSKVTIATRTIPTMVDGKSFYDTEEGLANLRSANSDLLAASLAVSLALPNLVGTEYDALNVKVADVDTITNCSPLDIPYHPFAPVPTFPGDYAKDFYALKSAAQPFMDCIQAFCAGRPIITNTVTLFSANDSTNMQSVMVRCRVNDTYNITLSVQHPFTDESFHFLTDQIEQATLPPLPMSD
jgi:hypothetical protein